MRYTFCVAFLALAVGSGAAAQEEGGDEAASGAAETPSPPESPADEAASVDPVAPDNVPTSEIPRDTYEPIGPQLFPVYWRTYRTVDETTILSVLYVFRTTSRKDGSYSTLLAPIFYSDRRVEPPGTRMYLFPLLYFSGEDDDASFRVSLPFYYDFQRAESGFRYLFPLWMQTATDERKLTRDHVLFPLYRLTHDLRDAEEPVVRSRLGIWKILELWESRSSETQTDVASLTLFNWGEEAQWPVSLFRSSWEQEGESTNGFTYLFPLYWHRERIHASDLAILPLFGQFSGGGRSDLFLFPLLSRFGGGPGPESRADVLFPLFSYRSAPESLWVGVLTPIFSYSRRHESFSVATRPFYSYMRSNEEMPWFSRLGVYSQSYTPATDKRAYSVLFPLVYHNVEPDDSAGNRWFFPYYETFNETRGWRFLLPLYLQWRARAGGTTDRFFSYGLPTYFAWGNPDDYFAFAFPLYWADHEGKRGWRVLAPLYYDFYSATSRGLYALPLFVWRDLPSRNQLAIAWPAYVYQKFFGLDGEPTGSSHSLLWPLTKVESRTDGYDYRLLPLFWFSRQGDYRGMLLSPLYFQQDGPRGTHRYFIPFYGRHETAGVTTDYYAAGTVIRSEEKSDAGEVQRSKLDLLWSLASFEDDYVTGGGHTHFLPIGYWNTRSPQTDRTILGPLHYSHRIIEEEKEHNLSLFLGNLFFSKTVTAPAPPAPSAPEGEDEVQVDQPIGAGRPNSGRGGRGGLTVPAVSRDRDLATPSWQDASMASRAAAADSPLFPLQVPSGEPASPPLDSTAPDLDRATAVVQNLGAPPQVERQEVWRDRGVLWPLSRWYQSADGDRGAWVIPFYFDTEDEFTKTDALFPLYFRQKQERKYDLSFFRYFFLYNHETWLGGNRTTVGQLLFDWFADEVSQTFRLRLLYPIVEFETNREGFSFEFTPACRFEQRLVGGELVKTNRFFPFYWQGSTERLQEGDGDAESRWQTDRSHFFLFPLFGYSSRSTRTDYHVVFPLFHLQDSQDALRFEVWPSIFYRDEPSLFGLRLWPLHADETGEVAGEFWVSRYLFFSKRFVSTDGVSYRFDPFLFRYGSGPESFGIGALFEMMAYDRDGSDWSFHALPFAFGSRDGDQATWGMIPLYYSQDFGANVIDHAVPWRFFFPVNHLYNAAGEHHTSILWFLYDQTTNPTRPDYHERSVLKGLFLDRSTETSRQFSIQPFYSYFRDDATDETDVWYFLYFYRYHKEHGEEKRRIFWFIPF